MNYSERLNKLNQNIRTLSDQINIYIQNSKRKIEELQLNPLINEPLFEKLKTQVQELETERSNLELKLDEQERQYQSVIQDKLNQYRSELEKIQDRANQQLQMQLSKREKQFTNQIKQYETTISKNNLTIESLQNQLRQLQQNNQVLTNELSEIDRNKETYCQSYCDKLFKQYRENIETKYKNEYSQLVKNIEDDKNEIVDLLKRTRDELDRERTTHKQELDQLRQQFENELDSRCNDYCVNFLKDNIEEIKQFIKQNQL